MPIIIKIFIRSESRQKLAMKTIANMSHQAAAIRPSANTIPAAYVYQFLDILIQLYTPLPQQIHAEMRAMQDALLYGTPTHLEHYMESLQEKVALRNSYKEKSRPYQQPSNPIISRNLLQNMTEWSNSLLYPDIVINKQERVQRVSILQTQEEDLLGSHERDGDGDQKIKYHSQKQSYQQLALKNHCSSTEDLQRLKTEGSVSKGKKKMNSSKIKEQIMSKSQQKSHIGLKETKKISDISMPLLSSTSATLAVPGGRLRFSGTGSDKENSTGFNYNQDNNYHSSNFGVEYSKMGEAKNQNTSTQKLAKGMSSNSSKTLLRIVRKKPERERSIKIYSARGNLKEHKMSKFFLGQVNQLAQAMEKNDAVIQQQLLEWGGWSQRQLDAVRTYSEVNWATPMVGIQQMR